MPLVERRHENGDTIVVLRYAAVFYWLMWPTVLATIWASTATSSLSSAVAAVAWIALLLVAIPYWPTVVEVKRRMKTSGVTGSGSKYSLSNPLTYRWPAADGEPNA